MSRSINSFSIASVLLFATLVAGIPTGLRAEPNPSPTKPVENITNQKVTSPQATLTPTSIAPTPTQKTGSASSKAIPINDTVNLILNLKQKQVYVYKGDKVIAKYPVAIGKKGWETPIGEWQVMEKIENPGWTNFKNGKVIKPGKNNPLGERWIAFWTDGEDLIGFHGTPDVKSVGTAASHGCVRMYNRDVKALYPLVKVGTTVKVVEQ